MGKIVKTITDYQCDNCRVLESNRDSKIWIGFAQGNNVPSYLSSRYIFCSETCGETWLLKSAEWFRELSKNDLEDRFREFK